MRTRQDMLAAIAIMVALAVPTSHAQDPKTVLTAAANAMGSTLLGNIQFTATGTSNAMGQSFRPDGPWPAFKLTRYKMDVDYLIPAIRVDLERTNPDGPVQGGGGLPLAAPQRQIQSARVNTAWNMADLNGVNAAPAPIGDRLLQIWTTPHGVIKAAQKAGADLKVVVERGADGRGISVLTVPAAGTIVRAMLNADNLVERVETRADNPVLFPKRHQCQLKSKAQNRKPVRRKQITRPKTKSVPDRYPQVNADHRHAAFTGACHTNRQRCVVCDNA